MGIGCNSSFWKDTLKMGGIISGGTKGSSIMTPLGAVTPRFGTNKVSPDIRLSPWQTNPVSMLTAGLTPNSNVLTAAHTAAHQGLGVGRDIFKGSGLWF